MCVMFVYQQTSIWWLAVNTEADGNLDQSSGQTKLNLKIAKTWGVKREAIKIKDN